MSLYEKLVKREEKLSLIGLGYVGMPLAVAFSKVTEVIGFDINEKKVEMYKQGILDGGRIYHAMTTNALPMKEEQDEH